MEVDGKQTAVRRSARKRKTAAGSSGEAQEGLAAEASQQATPEADCQDFNPLQVGSAMLPVPTRVLQRANGQPARKLSAACSGSVNSSLHAWSS